MDIGEAIKALKEGKKIRRASNPNVILYVDKIGQFFTTDTIPSLIREENGEWRHSDLYGRLELFAEDWEVIEDIPKIKLQRSTEAYYECPKCKRTDSIIVYIENVHNNDTLHECRYCGQKFNLINLKEAYDWGQNKDYDNTLTEYKQWLEITIKDFDDSIQKYLKDKQYKRAGDFERSRDCLQTCLDVLNKFERKNSN